MKLTIAMCVSLVGGIAFAGNGTFVNSDGGLWSERSNWSEGSIAEGAGSVAIFSAELSNNATVSIGDATTNTIGSLYAVNSGNPARKWTVSGTGSALRFDKGGSEESVINVADSTVLELTGIDDANDVVKTGPGTLRLALAAVGAFKTNSLVIREGTNYFTSSKYNYAKVTLDSSDGRNPVLRVCNAEQKSNGLNVSVPAGTGNPVFIQEANGKSYAHSVALERMLEVQIPANNANFGSFTGTGGIRKTGSGTLVFGNTPSFSGNIIISEGWVSCGSTGSSPSGNIVVTLGDEKSGSSAIGWSFSEKSLTGANVSFRVTQYGGQATFNWAKSQNGGTCASAFVLDRNIVFNMNLDSGVTKTFSGVFSGAGGISFTGSGNDRNFVLNGANTYTGGTSINSVAVKVGSESALGTGDVSVGATGILTYNAQLESAIDDKAKLDLATGAVVDFGSYAVVEKVGALYFNGEKQRAGIWGAVGSGCENETGFITGSGVIRVGGAGLSIVIR